MGVKMGHLAGKDVFHALGGKLEGIGTNFRAVNNEKFYNILKELFSAEEARLVVAMPYGLSTLARLEKTTGFSRSDLERLLSILCDKGLVMDMASSRGFLYTPSPMVFGFFEFTMMRVGKDLPYKTWAKLFYDYLSGDDTVYRANFSNGEICGIGRTLPHEDSVAGVTPENATEILDYESALALVDRSKSAALGICSCRHEKLHTGTKKCAFGLETCLSFGDGADYLSRHNMAKAISKEEAKDRIAAGKEAGLVLIADNVRRDVSFICQCCGCCCGMLEGINHFGYLNSVTTSNYSAVVDSQKCVGCGKCGRVCPVNAITTVSKQPVSVVEDRCLGCGVCATLCPIDAIKLVGREKRAYHPVDFFERALVSNLERGTLQNFIFDNPNSTRNGFYRFLLGGFLRLAPVKQLLVRDTFRSRFLDFARRRSGDGFNY
jgi:Fe-S-cluster-containing hydrogenase component 2